ncbi:endo-1,3(4)-beta-glucanase [Mortierella sp. GBAus27b]|nr:endo-1,3(4)-beta-glucanase [Mortierella sp. GBAus27b]
MCTPGTGSTGPPDTILRPISADPPQNHFKTHSHVVEPKRVRMRDRAKPIPTNKFYGNLVLGDSHAPIWTHPYGLRWESNGLGQHGLGISHIDDNMKALGPEQWIAEDTGRVDGDSRPGTSKYYINPFLVSMGLSAAEFDAEHDMTVGDFGEFGCTMVLSPASERMRGALENPNMFIRVPIVRGMAFITGVYQGLTPQIFSTILVRKLTRDPKPRADGWVKYKFLIENGVTWVLYAKPNRAQDPALDLKMTNQGRITAVSGKFTGLIQIAKLPVGHEVEAEGIYDSSVGVYASGGELVARQKDAGGYRIDWKLAGDMNKQFIHFTLPHHREIITDLSKPTSLVLPSTTKGKMVAYVGSSWHLYEPERLSVGFLPNEWSCYITQEQLEKIEQQAQQDVELDFDGDTNLDSMYFAGKGLAKFALLSLVVTDVLQDQGQLRERCLRKLKAAFERFLDNKQMFPLVYDMTWKGLISIQGLQHGALADFGNSWYNDHHYHYGYFIHTAAIIRHLDPEWRASDLTSFVNSLLRDVANPSTADPYYPVFRSFDWFMGHSWSQGIFMSLDGKDEESTSEDINLYYAMSLWGRVSNRPELDQLGQLMLTIARRSIQNYFLLEDDNTNHPRAFVGNKVTGILFENKVDHATYFSPRIECIQGIQMIPATPALPLVRRREFVQQEWDSLLRAHVGQINDGWKSILMMNYGMLDKEEAWKYFSGPVPLDDGMTKTWAMFYVASLQP